MGNRVRNSDFTANLDVSYRFLENFLRDRALGCRGRQPHFRPRQIHTETELLQGHILIHTLLPGFLIWQIMQQILPEKSRSCLLQRQDFPIFLTLAD